MLFGKNMKEPPSIKPMPGHGPDFDPMDRIVQEIQNVQNFLAQLSTIKMNSHDYMHSHMRAILSIRKSINEHIAMLGEEPYHFSEKRLKNLLKENEQIFMNVEGVIGAMDSLDQDYLNRLRLKAENSILDFDRDLTP